MYIALGIIRFTEILKSVNCACSMNAPVVTENVQPAYMLPACDILTSARARICCKCIVTLFSLRHNFVRIHEKRAARNQLLSPAAFYKSRLDFISFQRRIYIYSSLPKRKTKREAAGWHLVLYHSVATSPSKEKKEKQRGKKEWGNVKLLSLIPCAFVGRRSLPDVSLGGSNRKRVIKMTWPAPKTMSMGRRGGERRKGRYPLRREAAGNKTFKSSGGQRGRRARGSEQCNNLGESYSAGAGEPLMNFEL